MRGIYKLIAISTLATQPCFTSAQVNLEQLDRYSSMISEDRRIEAEGRVLLTGDLNINKGYEKAELIAKNNASKKFGEYFEVIKEVDDKNNEIKEVVVSVSSALLKYEVVSRKPVTDESGNIFLVVKIKAEAKKRDLENTLQKYYANTSLKNTIKKQSSEISALKSRLSLMSKALLNTQIDSAASESGSSSFDYERLTKQVMRLEADLYKKIIFASGDDLSDSYKAEKNNLTAESSSYLKNLKVFYSSGVKISLKSSTKNDFINDKILVYVGINLSQPSFKPESLLFHNGVFDRKNEARYRNNLVSYNLPRYMAGKSLVSSAYKVELIVDMNGSRAILPLIIPKAGGFDFTTHLDFDASSDYNPSVNIENEVELHARKMVYDLKNKLSYSVPVGEDVNVTYSIIATNIVSDQSFRLL